MTRISAPILALAAAASLAAPAQSQAPPQAAAPVPILTAEQATALRCGVGFGVIHRLQADGAAAGKRFPALENRGREYFVRVAAKVMDETGADRAAVGKLVAAQNAELVGDEAKLAAIMPGCVALLEAAGL